MDIDAKESFVRWQTAIRKHFTATSNLVLGLATGLLVFICDRGFVHVHVCSFRVVVSTTAVLLLIGSIALGLLCSINRLRDFRATAQVARRRMKGETVQLADREETKALGDKSWRLLWWQLVLFGLGTLTTAIAVAARAWSETGAPPWV